MTHPPANDRRSDDDRRNSVTPERPGLEAMIVEAEALAIAAGRRHPAGHTLTGRFEAPTSPQPDPAIRNRFVTRIETRTVRASRPRTVIHPESWAPIRKRRKFMSRFSSWPGPLVRRQLSHLIETLETLVDRREASRGPWARSWQMLPRVDPPVDWLLATQILATRWDEVRQYQEWDDESDYDDRYREVDAESMSPQETPASRWRRALSIGCQAAGWWLARQVGRNPVVMATSLGVSAALLSYVGRTDRRSRDSRNRWRRSASAGAQRSR